MFHERHREQLNPILPKTELVSDTPENTLTVRHQQKIREADGILIFHSNWGRCGLPIGLLKVKTALVFIPPILRRNRNNPS